MLVGISGKHASLSTKLVSVGPIKAMFHQVNYRVLPTLMPEEEFQFQANKNHLNVNILVMN